jgi:ankyrin repeat protein
MREPARRDPTSDEPGSLARKKRKKHRPLSFSAMETGDFAMLGMLRTKNPDLAHEIDLNGMTLLRTAVFQGRDDVVSFLRETAGPLDGFEAAALGETARLEELLDAGEVGLEDESPEGYGLLHLCGFFGRRETAEMLLDRGARIDAVASSPLATRPVHCAAASRQHDMACWLLDRGADVAGPQAGGWTLLHHAAQQGSVELAEDLLGRGADPLARNAKGQTPLDVARGLGHEDLARRLEPEG